MERSILALALAAVLVGILGLPASALGPTGCCICQGCVTPPVTQCFENPTQGCATICSDLNCTGFSNTQISCGQQPLCPAFTAPAAAPALAPSGLGAAAVVLAGLGWLAMRRR